MAGLVITGGRVVDPASGMDAVGDVAVLDGKIAAVGTGLGSAERTIDATGLVVAPGFIDLHAHGQSIPADRMQAFDGVTTTLDLEAGVMPVASWYSRQAAERTRAELRCVRQLGVRADRRDDRLQFGKLAGGIRQCDARPPLDRECRQRDRGGGHPRTPCRRAERGRHRHRHPQRLCAGRRRAGIDRGVPTGGGARTCRPSPTSPTCRASTRRAPPRPISA